MKKFLIFIILVLWGTLMAQENICDILIKNTTPVTVDTGKRLPVFVWARIPTNLSEEDLTNYLKALDERKLVMLTGWRIPKEGIEKGIEESIKIDKIRKNLNLPVFVDATSIVHRFFDGSQETAHTDDDGKPFFDTSFSKGIKIGCPFRVEQRYPVITDRIERFLQAYKKEGIKINYWAVDWEVDGPMEWNDAWQNSKKCKICRQNIKNIDNFEYFQKTIRTKRAELQNEVFVKTVKNYYPDCLIGNYAVNPHDGYRYWYDYFERETSAVIYQKKHNALHRKWFDEFKYAGYTMAMPVIYTWYKFFSDYTFQQKEYRWFYPLMREITSAGKNTKSGVPIISFVHWQTVLKPEQIPPDFVPLSREKYKELLWHMLLRGHDAFCVWSPVNEMAQEIKVVHEVFVESLRFNNFILNGKVVLWNVPEEPDTVLSALALKNKLLVIRTDFNDKPEELKIKINGRPVKIPLVSGPFVLEIK